MRSNTCTLSIVLFVLVFVFGQAGGGDVATAVGPKLWIDSTAIDLGKIAVDQEQIKGVIR